MKPSSLIFFFLIVLFSCKQKTGAQIKSVTALTVSATDSALIFTNGILSYKGQLFTGTVEEKYAGGMVRSEAKFSDGKENGLTKTFYEDGEKETERFYSNGDKDSVGKGWWPGGIKKFEYHYSKGNYNGAFTEWYISGKMNQQIMYANGKELSGKGWRENGTPYLNFTWRGNRRYGLVNPNMCYGISNGAVKERQLP